MKDPDDDPENDHEQDGSEDEARQVPPDDEPECTCGSMRKARYVEHLRLLAAGLGVVTGLAELAAFLVHHF